MLLRLDRMCDDETEQREIYVGNLDSSATEDLIMALFSPIGQVTKCTFMKGHSDPYCFIEFADSRSAQTAITTMHGRFLLEKQLRVNWAVGLETQQKTFTVFVRELDGTVDTDTLRNAFTPFGKISRCQVVFDSDTHKSRGYGFVAFVKKMEAENALLSMDGELLCGKPIRTGWANSHKLNSDAAPLSYEQVFNKTSPTNCTVHCGGLKKELTDSVIMKTFRPFGIIRVIRVCSEQGYAFVTFSSKESATNAIVALHNTEVNRQRLKCSWSSKDSRDSNQKMAADCPADSVPRAVQLKYQEVFNQSSPTNCTVHCSGMKGELTHEVLVSTFSPYGVIRYMRVFEEKGYAFITFCDKQTATNAIVSVHGSEVNGQKLNCNWAKDPRAPNEATAANGPSGFSTYEEAYYESSPTNCNVYLGGVMKGLTRQLVMTTFRPYGVIRDMRVFENKGYAFITFRNKESATNAILSVDNTEVNGHLVKCSWGRDSGDLNQTPAPSGPAGSVSLQAAHAQYSYCSSGQMGQWHPEPQGYPAAAQTQGFQDGYQ